MAGFVVSWPSLQSFLLWVQDSRPPPGCHPGLAALVGSSKINRSDELSVPSGRERPTRPLVAGVRPCIPTNHGTSFHGPPLSSVPERSQPSHQCPSSAFSLQAPPSASAPRQRCRPPRRRGLPGETSSPG